jgi:hypothetical protein
MLKIETGPLDTEVNVFWWLWVQCFKIYWLKAAMGDFKNLINVAEYRRMQSKSNVMLRFVFRSVEV